MCAQCVAQGAVYVGGALASLQVMAARARNRRRADTRRSGTGSRRGPGPEQPDRDRPTSGVGATPDSGGEPDGSRVCAS